MWLVRVHKQYIVSDSETSKYCLYLGSQARLTFPSLLKSSLLRQTCAAVPMAERSMFSTPEIRFSMLLEYLELSCSLQKLQCRRILVFAIFISESQVEAHALRRGYHNLSWLGARTADRSRQRPFVSFMEEI